MHALSNLLSQAINNLHPSIPICIEDALKDEEDSLETLIQLLQIARRFILGLESAVRTYEGEFILKILSTTVDNIILAMMNFICKN